MLPINLKILTFNLVTIIMLMTCFKHSKLHKLLSLQANINWLLIISGTVWEMYFPKKVILCEVKRTKVNTQTPFPKHIITNEFLVESAICYDSPFNMSFDKS